MARKRFGTLSDIRRYLADVLNRLDSGELADTEAKSRAYIANILASVIHESDNERRMSEIEKHLRDLKEDRK